MAPHGLILSENGAIPSRMLSRHVWRSFKASMGKFFSSLVDPRQVYIFRHVDMHLKCILGPFLIRIRAQMVKKITKKQKLNLYPSLLSPNGGCYVFSPLTPIPPLGGCIGGYGNVCTA